MTTAIVIPARLDSTRLPGKLMLDICGKPLIWYTINNVLQCEVDYVFVVTDSKIIYDYVSSLNIDIIILLTDKATSGTHRISKIASNIKTVYNIDNVINVQGDEPTTDFKLINEIASQFKYENRSTIITAAHITKPTVDPNKVKIALNKDYYAMYFSRSEIPYEFEITYRHIGIYGYTMDFFENYSKIVKCPYEKENLEQLDWLYNDIKIKVLLSKDNPISVDTHTDYNDICCYFKTRLMKEVGVI